MKKFKGKIGKYAQCNQRQRSRIYLKRSKEDRQMNRDYITAYEYQGYNVERNLVDKLKMKKGGKLRDEVIKKESVEECRDICPGWGY